MGVRIGELHDEVEVRQGRDRARRREGKFGTRRSSVRNFVREAPEFERLEGQHKIICAREFSVGGRGMVAGRRMQCGWLRRTDHL